MEAERRREGGGRRKGVWRDIWWAGGGFLVMSASFGSFGGLVYLLDRRLGVGTAYRNGEEKNGKYRYVKMLRLRQMYISWTSVKSQ